MFLRISSSDVSIHGYREVGGPYNYAVAVSHLDCSIGVEVVGLCPGFGVVAFLCISCITLHNTILIKYKLCGTVLEHLIRLRVQPKSELNGTNPLPNPAVAGVTVQE